MRFAPASWLAALTWALAVPALGQGRSPASGPWLESGLYLPVSGNHEAICPQQVRAIHQDGELTALVVAYAGDCLGMGTFEYYCLRSEEEGLVCEWNGIRFDIRARDRYRWSNLGYGFWGEFKLAPPSLQAGAPRSPRRNASP